MSKYIFRNEKGGFESAYDKNSLMKLCYEEISDLEAKLEESEKKVKHWHNLYNERDKQFQSVRQRYHLLNKLQSNYDKKDKLHLAYMQCAELVDENEQLKQQLAEKDKELSEYVKIVDDLHKQLSDKCDFCDKTRDQDKISFAVEQLEKVKNYMITDEKDMFGANYLMNSVYVLEFIDNQIKQLKEMK